MNLNQYSNILASWFHGDKINLKYNKEKMPKEKDGYKMRMIVPKPTDPEKLKKREELSNRLKEYPNEELKKVLEWIQAKKEQEERERKEEEERKAREVPKEIKDFRKNWKKKIERLDDETKKR